MQRQGRIIEQLVDEQVAKWNRLKATSRGKEDLRTVITISREPGADGTAIAKKLAETTGMDFMSGQIIQKVAQSAQLSEHVVASLDEKDISFREDWLRILLDDRHLWPDSFLRHLIKVISTIGLHGNAIIIGRGANHILPPSQTFRVRLIAPKEHRISNLMRNRKLSRNKAEEYLIKTESDRNAFIRKYFYADISDPVHYDIVMNTSRLNIEGSVETIRHAYNSWRDSILRKHKQ